MHVLVCNAPVKRDAHRRPRVCFSNCANYSAMPAAHQPGGRLCGETLGDWVVGARSLIAPAARWLLPFCSPTDTGERDIMRNWSRWLLCWVSRAARKKIVSGDETRWEKFIRRHFRENTHAMRFCVCDMIICKFRAVHSHALASCCSVRNYGDYIYFIFSFLIGIANVIRWENMAAEKLPCLSLCMLIWNRKLVHSHANASTKLKIQSESVCIILYLN